MSIRCNRVQLVAFLVTAALFTVWLRNGEHYEPNEDEYRNGGYKNGNEKGWSSKQGGHAAHFVRGDGLLEVNMEGRHPILELVEEGERRWKEMLKG